jgi:hypothetical protein
MGWLLHMELQVALLPLLFRLLFAVCSAQHRQCGERIAQTVEDEERHRDPVEDLVPTLEADDRHVS